MNTSYRALGGPRAAHHVFLALFALALAAPMWAQSQARDSFLAIQKQVEAVQPRIVKSTVALRLGGASGSGVIISPDGFVLTAAHVIAGPQSRRCSVVLSDGRRFQATVLGSNAEDDYGMVKILNATDLPTAPLGDSSTLRPGQWVLATGHPLGLKEGRPGVLRIGRVLAGGRGRRQVSTQPTASRPEPRRIATDAPLISGDSGGPLFDLNGRVVGINSMITSGSWMTSIHVPVNLPKAVLNILQEGENPSTSDGQSTAFARAKRDAEEALAADDNATAVRAATAAAEADSTSAAARILLARAYARTGKTSLAATAIQQACDLGFNDVSYLRRDPDLSRVNGQAALKPVLDRLDALNGVPGNRKGDQSLLAAAAGIEPSLDRGVVRIMLGEKDVALGTVMSVDGDVLTKASELPQGPLTCALPDGRTVSAERRGVDANWDVALLKVKASKLETISLADTAPAGAWTFSPNALGGVAAVGLVGVAEMPVVGKGIAPKPTSKAYMGAYVGPVEPDTLKELGVSSGVQLRVEPDLPAARAGLQTGDVVLQADGKTVTDPDMFMDLLVEKQPGDTLKLAVARGKDRLNLTVNLATRPADLPGRGGLPEFLSGEVSRMAGPFPHVLHHDAILRPKAMGGPLLDSDGKCVGLNIARADRTSTYAIPAKDVKEIYARLKAKP